MAKPTRVELLALLAEAIGDADDRDYPDDRLSVEDMATAALAVVEERFTLWGLLADD